MPTKSGSPTPPKSPLSSFPNLLESPRQSSQSEAEVETPIDSTTAGPSVFDQTTQNLLRLGSLTLDKFAQDPSEELDGFDIPLVDLANPTANAYHLGDTAATRNTSKAEDESDEIKIVAPNEAIRFLRDIAQREFGTSFDPLKYEYIEEPGQTGKCCILTVNRPNGLSRSYRTKAEFTRKSDAKIAAASSAIKLGVISFIKHGDGSTVGGKRGLVLAKLDAVVKKDEGDTEAHLKNLAESQSGDESDGERMVAEIEKCCFEWRAGLVVPRWVVLFEKKNLDAYGCALKISLSAHIQRTYSVQISTHYARRSLAKGACAKVALEQGILEFIKHGDGLKEPIVVPFIGAEAMAPSGPPTLTTLQAFHAALPKPMPDHIGTKSNGEINAIAWVNTIVQTAKGSRMSVMFHWYTDSKIGLHGCLLHLSRPDGPSQSYLVDSIFPKRSDAKLAVCLLACSQGLGDYIRGVVAEIEARVSTEMRRRCTEEILPALGQALNKVRHGLRPDFEYDCDLSTFGCTLTINLSSDLDSETPVTRQWKVPLAYRSKADAKIAVACAAADDGLIDFVKYRGQPPPLTPDDQASEVEVVNEVAEAELEDGETTIEGGKKKKNKKMKKDDGNITGEVRDSKVKGTGRAGNVPLLETKEEARARGRYDAAPGKKIQQRNFNGRGRGAGFGRHGGFGHAGLRGGFSRSSDAPARRRPFGGPGGYPTPHPNTSQFYHPYSHFPHHASRASAHFHPYPFVSPAGGLGFPGGLYPLEYEHGGYFLNEPGPAHERYSHGLSGSSVDTATSFTHAPPPVLPPVMPDHHGYHDRDRSYDFTHECEYGEGLSVQPSYSSAVSPSGSRVPSGVPHLQPYDFNYPTAGEPHPPDFNGYPQAMSVEYACEDDEYSRHLARGQSHPYELGHYAPDYDRIPDRSAVTHVSRSHAHEGATLRRSGGAASMNQVLTTPHVPSHSSPSHPEPMAVVQSPSHPSVAQQDGSHIYDPHKHLLHAERLRPRKLSSLPRQVQPQPVVQEHPQIGNKLDSVTSGLKKEGSEMNSEYNSLPNSSLEPSQLLSPTSGQTPSISPLPVSGSSDGDTFPLDGSVTVPSKRSRSWDGENEDSGSNKRPRRRSRGDSQDGRDGSSDPPSKGRKSVPDEDLEPSLEKTVSPALDVDEAGVSASGQAQDSGTSLPAPKPKGRQKEKSYVAALLDKCVKEGKPSPEFCHEMCEETDKPFKVWVIMGKERLELPASFPTLDAGKERLAKSVLGRMKVQSKMRKEN